MDFKQDYKIGILLDVNDAQLKTLSKFSEQMTTLSRRFTSLTKKITEFNSAIGDTSDLFTVISDKLAKFGTVATASLREAKLETNSLNRALKETFVISHAGGGGRHGLRGGLAHHFGKEAGGGVGGLLAKATSPEVALPAAAGAFLGYEGYKHASVFQQHLSALRAGNYFPGFGGMAANAALTANLPGISPVDYLEAAQSAAAVTRSGKQALLLTPALAMQTLTMQKTYGKWSAADEANIARFVELWTGSYKASTLSKGIDFSQKLFGTEAGKMPSYFLSQFARRYGSGIKNIDETGMMELLPIMQAYGGSQTGAALRTLQAAFARGQNFKTGKKGIAMMEKVGIWDSKTHSIKHFDEFLKRPAEFFANYVMGKEQAAGLTTEQQQVHANAVMFSGIGAVIADLIMQQKSKIQQSVVEGQRAMDLSKAWASMQKTEGAAGQRTAAAWDKFATAIGLITSTPVIGGLNAITWAFTKLANLLNAFYLNTPKVKNAVSTLGNVTSSPIFHPFNMIKSAITGQGFSLQPITINLDGKTIAQVHAKTSSALMSRPQPISNSIIPNWVQAIPGSNYGLLGGAR